MTKRATPKKPPPKSAEEYRKALVNLTEWVRQSIREIDDTMRAPESLARGKRIAAITNQLEMINDRVRFFTLDIDWRKLSCAERITEERPGALAFGEDQKR